MVGLIDNDILLKGACYGILAELVSCICPMQSLGVLGAARFVVTKRIGNASLNGDKAAALKALTSFLNQACTLEPTDEEDGLAADLELAAQRMGVSLDTGESQLCAIFVTRLLAVLLTGDKRAIMAMERMYDWDTRVTYLQGRVMCLEQMFAALIGKGHEGLREAVCKEPTVDKALSNCFSCHSQHSSVSDPRDGLNSYIAALRRDAGRVLS